MINLEKIVSGASQGDGDVILRNNDRLVVPSPMQEVSVLGEVRSPTSHLYRPNTTRDNYIAMSGGMTKRANRKHPYVVRADGSFVGASGEWLGGGRGNVKVQPGDTVVVPLDAGNMRPLPMWTASTTIIHNLAVAAAAVARF